MHIIFICVEAVLLGAPSVFPSIPPLIGAAMFYGGLAGLLVYPLWLFRERILDRVKMVEPTHLILTGLAGVIIFACVALAGVIWQTQRGPAPARYADESKAEPQRVSDFNWGFEIHRGYNFIGMSAPNGGAVVIHQFQAQGRNLTNDPLVNYRGYVRSDRTNKEYPILFNLGGKFYRHDELNPIPTGAIIDTRAYFSEDGSPITLQQFLADIVPLTFFFEYDGKKYRRSFSLEEIEPLIRNYEQEVRKSAVKPPQMSKKVAAGE